VEKIWGPVNGFYVAAYAQRVGDERRFATYAKVCWRAPQDYWDAQCLFKLFGGEHHGSEEAALLHMRRIAYAKIACIPPAARTMLAIASRDDAARLFLPLASAIRSHVSHTSPGAPM
jgi:hypothetical protein